MTPYQGKLIEYSWEKYRSIIDEVLRINYRLIMKMWIGLALAVVAISGVALADDKESARADIQKAVAIAAAQHQQTLVIFGASWCGDCKALNASIKEGKAAPLFAKDFQIVHVDVGQFDKNEDVADSYGVPLKKGIPAVAIVSTNNTVLYATKEGELSNARYMGEDGIYKFFKKVTDEALAKGK